MLLLFFGGGGVVLCGSVLVLGLFVFGVFSFLLLPSTSLWGVYSETFIHRCNIPLTHAVTRLCMSFPSHVHPALCLDGEGGGRDASRLR